MAHHSQDPAVNPILRDSELTFPDFTLVTASAGSGKTTALTRRFLQLLLSGMIPFHDLKNILAITFTNNVAAEMKARILKELKEAAFGIPGTIRELEKIISSDPSALSENAGRIVDEILDHYSDFRVQTIDSFITRVLKSAAIEFGLPPDFRISIDTSGILDEALALMERDLTSDRAKREVCAGLADRIGDVQPSDAKFLWNPFLKISDEVSDLYSLLSSLTGEPVVRDDTVQLKEEGEAIVRCLLSIADVAESYGLVIAANYQKIIALARRGNVDELLKKSLSQKIVNKSTASGSAQGEKKIHSIQEECEKHAGEYIRLKSRAFYQPYVRAHLMLRESIAKVKRRRAELFLGEANRILAERLNNELVPEIYFSMGERIYHYLIDEFQDTSPVQWSVLRPLIENSLAQEGSLFCVGDTKQSIYTFRGADWRIMRRMQDRQEFPSAEMRTAVLDVNWRSAGAIVDFTTMIFHEQVPRALKENASISDLSGLASFSQRVRKGEEKHGFVSVRIIPAPDKERDTSSGEEEPDPEHPPEEKILLGILESCRSRGYSYRDIAILTPKNKHVVAVSRWLNGAGIRFLSHSSLDIRTRAITGELLALFRFLDSPIDDLSFSTVILGELFSRVLARDTRKIDPRRFLEDARLGQGAEVPLYTLFREAYPALWSGIFERLFHRVGYLSVYDLLAQAYSSFDVFTMFPEEESTLVKFLEVIRNFEITGKSSLKDFLAWASDGDSREWDIEVSPAENAVAIMTIHKAKGLGFPVCINLFYDSSPRSNNRIVSRTGEGNLELLRVKKDWAEKSTALAPLSDEDRISGWVDELNKLYVALTRAREELYVLAVQSKRGKTPSQFLPPDGYSRGMQALKKQGAAETEIEAALLHVNGAGFAEESDEREIVQGDAGRGEYIHAILSRITTIGEDPAVQIDAAIRSVGNVSMGSATPESVGTVLLSFLRLPSVLALFSGRPGRIILNEQDIVGAAGTLYRIDRLIIDPDQITVVDYKTGGEKPEYESQVRGYCALVSDAWPAKRVRGILAFVDRKTIVEVT